MAYKSRPAQLAAQKAWAAHRWKHDPEYKRKHTESTKRIRDRNQRVYDQWKAQGCKYCPEDSLCCLQAHHRDPEAKVAAVSKMVTDKLSVEKIEAELDKCDCVCANCHFKLHAGELYRDVVC